MLRSFHALGLALALLASPAGAVTAFVTGTVTEVVGGVSFLPDVEVGDAFQVTITYDQWPCDFPLAGCTHNQTFYQESIVDVVMTVDGQTVGLGGGATHAVVLIQNDLPGDRIEMSSPVLANSATMAVVLAGGVMPVVTAFAYAPSGDLGAVPGWDPGQSRFNFRYQDPFLGNLFFRGAIDVAPIPEPATSALVLGGLVALSALTSPTARR